MSQFKSQLSKRARSTESKHNRRLEILRHAKTLAADVQLDSWSMDRLAASAGLAKGTLYLYFKTKEAVVLGLFLQEISAWSEDLQKKWRGSTPLSAEAFSKHVVESLEDRPELPKLMGLLHIALEKNLEASDILLFKTELKDHLDSLASVLAHRLMGLSSAQVIQLLFQVYALITGLWPLTNPSPLVRQVTSIPELQIFQQNFSHALKAAIESLLLGTPQTSTAPKAFHFLGDY